MNKYETLSVGATMNQHGTLSAGPTMNQYGTLSVVMLSKLFKKEYCDIQYLISCL